MTSLIQLVIEIKEDIVNMFSSIYKIFEHRFSSLKPYDYIVNYISTFKDTLNEMIVSPIVTLLHIALLSNTWISLVVRIGIVVVILQYLK